MEIFNRDSLMEIDVLYSPGAEVDKIATRIREQLISRRDNEDFTIVTQEQTLDTLGGILDILTMAIAAIGAIFLGEAVLLSAVGGAADLVLGMTPAGLLHLALPALPTHISLFYVTPAELVAVLIGLACGQTPAGGCLKGGVKLPLYR